MKRALLLTAAFLAACLGPRTDPSAFFLLSPAPAPPGAAPVAVLLGVGPVTIPGYLDRPEIVTRVSENEIVLAETDRWAEPLSENLVRTLEESLSGLLPGSSFVDYPWFGSRAPDYALTLDVRHFEADASGTVMLDATWRLARGDAPVGGRSVRIEESAAGPGRVAAVAAQSRALARLTNEIAAAVRSASGR